MARHARAGHPADDLGLDAEVAERLDQQLGDLLLVGGVGRLAAPERLRKRGSGSR